LVCRGANLVMEFDVTNALLGISSALLFSYLLCGHLDRKIAVAAAKAVKAEKFALEKQLKDVQSDLVALLQVKTELEAELDKAQSIKSITGVEMVELKRHNSALTMKLEQLESGLPAVKVAETRMNTKSGCMVVHSRGNN